MPAGNNLRNTVCHEYNFNVQIYFIIVLRQPRALKWASPYNAYDGHLRDEKLGFLIKFLFNMIGYMQ